MIIHLLFLAALCSTTIMAQDDLHKCARPWPIDSTLSNFKPLNLIHLANLNKNVLPVSSAGNLVRSDQDGGNTIKDAHVQVDVTFSGLATTIQLNKDCNTIVQPSLQAGELTNGNGVVLTKKDDQLSKNCIVVFTPHESFSGEAVLVYSLKSGANAAVVVQVVPCNHAPQANDDYAESISGRVIRLNLLSNDDDLEDEHYACMDFPSKTEAPKSAPTIVSFTNVAHELGLREEQCEVRTSPNCLFDQFDQDLKKWDDGGFCMQETLTGGGCVGDADNDGMDDIYYPRMDGHDIIYRNRGDGTFEDISVDSGMSRYLRVKSNGCVFVDIDNDGDSDIYVSTVADKQFMLFVNDGTGKFTEQAVKRGVGNIPNKTRFRSFVTAGGSIDVADFDLDGYLDIVTTEWLPQLGKPESGDKASFDKEYNTPGGNNARIFRNLGDDKPGYFEDVTQAVGYFTSPTGFSVADSMIANRQYNYGTNADIRQALSCVAPNSQTAATGISMQDPHLYGEDGDCHYMDQSCKENRTKLKIKFQHAINRIAGRDLNYSFFGIKHPMIGTYKGSASKSLGTQSHEHVFNIKADHTWELMDTITIHDEPDEILIITRTGIWKEDEESDYEGSFAEMKEIRSRCKILDSEVVGTPVITNVVALKWVQVNVFGKTAFHEGLGRQWNFKKMNSIAREFQKKMKSRGMKGGQMSIMNTIVYLFAPGQKVWSGVDDVAMPSFLGGGPYGGQGDPLETQARKGMKSNSLVPALGGEFDLFRYGGPNPPFKSMIMVYEDDTMGADGGMLEGATLVNMVCEKFTQLSLTQELMEENLRLVWSNPMNEMNEQTLEAHKYNMTLQDFSQWKQRQSLVKSSNKEDRGKRKKGINHFIDFPLNGVFSFGAKFVDMDNDSFPDLIISGDFGTSQMLWNNRNRTFHRGFFDVIEDIMDNSMGCTVGDWDQDGKTDIMFTSVSISSKDMKSLSKVSEGAGMSLSFNGNHLYKNLGDRRFEDKTDHAGVRLSGWGWGAFFFDFDNDGDLDVLNGNGMDDPETTDDDVFINQKMRLYVNKGKKEEYKMFDEAEAHGIADQSDNRGSMTFDYDGDGDLDVFVVNHGEVPSLYRNDGGDYYNWIRVRVKESLALGLRDSIGARVYVTLREPTSPQEEDNKVEGVKTIMREIKSAAAFCGQNELVAHFGLGKTSLNGNVVHSIRIVWPPIVNRGVLDGDSKLTPEDLTEVILYNVPIRQTLIIRRPPTNNIKSNLFIKTHLKEHFDTLAASSSASSSSFESGSPALIKAYTTATATKTRIVSNAGASLPICTHKKIAAVSSPSHGQVVIGTSGKYIKYRAFPHYSGEDSFTYTMTDGRGGSSTATVNINVKEPPSDIHKEAMRRAATKSKYSSLDGRGNNIEFPQKEASVFTQLLRLVPNAYKDGLEDPSGSDRPSARVISNVLFTQDDGNIDNRYGLNDMHLHFGQFLAHDISFVTPLADFYASGNLAIPVPKGDTTFDPDFTGEAVLRFRRSGGQSGTGKDFGLPKQQVNKVTGWLDLSVVYGSADERAAAIMSSKNGKIDMQDEDEETSNGSNGSNLAYNLKGIANLNLLGKKIERLVVSGDNRVNVQPGLLAHHTLWAREHNRLVDDLLLTHPTMTDRDLFLNARKENIATYQHIVMYEWLPLLLGNKYIHSHKLNSYKAGGSYNPADIDARIANEFASVAFRFGHSQVTDSLKRLNKNLKTDQFGHLNLRDNYFSPGRVMKQGGLDPILRGMIHTASQEVDTKAVDGVRNFLFGTNTKGFDLVAINIQRGRDHGIPDYNTLRTGLGLSKIQKWSEITTNQDVVLKLITLYGDDGYNNMDAFVGGLAEDHVKGGSVGELFATIIADQFYRLRNGDRHWYENVGVSGNTALIPRIQKYATMKQVVERNSNLSNDEKVWDGHRSGEKSAFLV